jgi:hypothetical protein
MQQNRDRKGAVFRRLKSRFRLEWLKKAGGAEVLDLVYAGRTLKKSPVFAVTAVVTIIVGVKATNPATFAVMAAFFFVVCAVASWRPAQRAAALDPTAALREE